MSVSLSVLQSDLIPPRSPFIVCHIYPFSNFFPFSLSAFPYFLPLSLSPYPIHSPLTFPTLCPCEFDCCHCHLRQAVTDFPFIPSPSFSPLHDPFFARTYPLFLLTQYIPCPACMVEALPGSESVHQPSGMFPGWPLASGALHTLSHSMYAQTGVLFLAFLDTGYSAAGTGNPYSLMR